MGGSAFASGPHALSTPRMPTAVYEAVRERCKAALRRLFVCVASPIEGPAKKDHGDVDIYVALTRRAVFGAGGDGDDFVHNDNLSPLEATAAAIARALGAERSIIAADASCNFAVPWPAAAAAGGDEERRFVQVDVRVCASIPQLQWLLFKHAHGDLWNVLGSVLRPCGLTVDDEALWVRVPEIEAHNRRRAKVFLTADPAAVLRFLGLAQDGAAWERPFASAEAMFEYAATCRFFRVQPPSEVDGAQEEEAAGPDRQRLRSNDRRRLATRDAYRRWVDEFVPSCRAGGRFLGPAPDRDAVRREALATFGLARWFYDKRVAEWRHERQEEEVWKSAIKATVPQDLDPQHRGVLCSALKKIVMQDDASFGVPPRADGGAGAGGTPFRDEEGWYRVDEVRAWVLQHWREVEAVAWQRQLERARDNLRAREAKYSPPAGAHAYGRGASSVPVS